MNGIAYLARCSGRPSQGAWRSGRRSCWFAGAPGPSPASPGQFPNGSASAWARTLRRCLRRCITCETGSIRYQPNSLNRYLSFCYLLSRHESLIIHRLFPRHSLVSLFVARGSIFQSGGRRGISIAHARAFRGI